MESVRIVDIAARLGVSVSTVSKSLNDASEISVATKDRVKVAAAEMGYRPNGAARRLRSGRTRAIGLLTHDSVGRFGLPVLLGAEDAAGAERVSALLCDARNDPIRLQHHVRTLLEHGIDGIIALASDTNDQPSLGDLGVPVVYAYGASANPDDYSVFPDEIAGARMAIEHVLSLGRTKIAHITGPESFASTRRRVTAMQSTLAKVGLTIAEPGPLIGDWTEAWGRSATELLLARHPEFDAIFCGSDLIARGVCDVLRDRGVSVPDDVSVVGFDNWEPMASGGRTPLTTIDMMLDNVGRTAAAALFDAINGRPRSGLEPLPCRLVVGESTAPIRKHG